MCGIFGILKLKNLKNIFNDIIDGLIQLQNRGYDSSGVCLLNKKEGFLLKKYASDSIKSSIDKLKENFINSDDEINIGIGHNRWATHGPKNDINAHPHISNNKKFILVHNGIIENYMKLKEKLIKNNYYFYSQTDTEVIVNLLQYNYDKCNDIYQSLSITVSELTGTYGLIILCLDYPNKLFCIRNGSPILIGKNDDTCIITSEQSGFSNKINSYFTLKNDDICTLEISDNLIKLKSSNSYINKKINISNTELTPDPYPFWTLKEINEQPSKILNSINIGGRILDNTSVKLGGLDKNRFYLKDISNIILLGCGTSYNSCMYGKEFLKKLCDFNTIQLFDGSDFEKSDIPNIGKSLAVFVSQSGETKDLHRCIEIVKSNGLMSIGIINVVDSLIAREVDCGIYCNAGREMGVASTKAFTTQVVCLSLLAIWFSQNKDINYSLRKEFIEDLQNLSNDFDKCLENIEDQIKDTIKMLNSKDNLFILGKNSDEAIAREGSLKIKEISYIHSEAYSTSSLKHGPFALLDENMPVIIINNNYKYESKVLNCYEEVSSRNSKIIFITNNNKLCKSNTILVPYNKSFSSLLAILPLQLIAYNLALMKNINPDKPKNLAKVVTVE